MKIFLDSDVIISSVISSLGAAYLLIHEVKDLDKFISNISLEELSIVANRLNIAPPRLKSLINNRFEIVNLKDSREFSKYTFDFNDSHIVAGAKKAKVKFLITYNIRHFNIEKVKQDLDIMVITPGKFLQYLRSVN